MGDFLSALFGGSSKTLNSTINKAGDISNFGTNTGQGAISDADAYYKSILSGDPTQTAMTLAPEIKAGQEQTQQGKNQLAQFGTRSGGTAAASAGADAANRANIISLIGKLRSGAAAGEAGIGENQTALGLNANDQQAQQSQQRMQNWLNSILSGVTTGAVSAGMGALGI